MNLFTNPLRLNSALIDGPQVLLRIGPHENISPKLEKLLHDYLGLSHLFMNLDVVCVVYVLLLKDLWLREVNDLFGGLSSSNEGICPQSAQKPIPVGSREQS